MWRPSVCKEEVLWQKLQASPVVHFPSHTSLLHLVKPSKLCTCYQFSSCSCLQLGPLTPSSEPLLIILPLNSSSSVFPARLVTFLLCLWYWKFLPVPQIEIAQHCFKLESVRKWACPWKRGNITLLLWRRWIPLKRSYLISSDAKTHFKAQKILLWLLEKERSDMSWICFAKENWLKTYKAITIRPFSRENHSKQVTEMHKMLQLWEQMQVVVLYHCSRGPLSSSAVHCPERWCGGGGLRVL